eukprot:403364778
METTNIDADAPVHENIMATNYELLRDLTTMPFHETKVIKVKKVIEETEKVQVYLVDIKISGQIKENVIMKVIRSQECGENAKINQSILNQIEQLMRIPNTYLNHIFTIYFQLNKDTNQKEFVILQQSPICDLQQFLDENYADKKMPEKLALEYFTQLTIGLKKLHDHAIIHENFNPKFIYYCQNNFKTGINTQENVLKIYNFTSSKIFGDEHKHSSLSEDQDEARINRAREIYDLGLIAFQMITGKRPSHKDIQQKNLDLQCYSQEFIDLLYQLCSDDLDVRPKINKILENLIIQNTQAFFDSLLYDMLPNVELKIEGPIDCLKNEQEYDEAEQEFIDSFIQMLPQDVVQERANRPLMRSIPEIARIFYIMNEVQTKFKANPKEWANKYKITIGNSDFQYLLDKYHSHLKQQINQKVDINYSLFRVKYWNGCPFIGFFKDNQDFYGIYHDQLSIREGYVQNGKFHGKGCIFGMDSSGDYYYKDGTFNKGVLEGQGIQIWSEGDMYCGNFKKGRRTGQGTLYKENGDIYEGNFVQGYFHGKGIYKQANGDVEQGIWVYDKENGKFIKTFRDGEKMKITFELGVMVQIDEA